LRLLAVVFGLVGLTAGQAAADMRVALVVPEDATDASSRAEERLRVELAGAGHDVVTVPVEGTAERGRLRSIAKRTGAVVVVSVRVDEDGIDGTVWVKDGATGREVVTPIRKAAATPEGAAVFAIWAAEQVRASVLALETPVAAPPAPVEPVGDGPKEEERAAPRSPPRASPTSSPSPRPGSIERRPSWTMLSVGPILVGHGSLPWAVGPSVTLVRREENWLGALRLSGPAVSTIEAESGSVNVDQEQLSLRVGSLLSGADAFARPYLVAGLGAYRLGVRGNAHTPYRSASNQAWSGLLEVAGGVEATVSDPFFVAVEAGTWILASRPVVKMAGSEDGSAGRAGYFGLTALGVSW
jgi:hypothetical protein